VKGHFLSDKKYWYYCSFLLFSTYLPSSYPTDLHISWSSWKH
jgi:hypothetical protein